MVVSFGIEFEFDSLNGQTLRYTSLGSNGAAFKDGFTYQPDGTAGTEMRTPVCIDVKEAADRISSVFAGSDPNFAPILKGVGPEHNSLGQHIHIGQPGRMLERHIKRRIALHARTVYPFLTAIGANSKANGNVSNRGRTSSFCRFLYTGEIMDNSHYGEISNSHVGTVEFRKFDANIPQASLLCATILKVVAQAAINGKRVSEPFEGYNYNEQMMLAVTRGISAMKVEEYLRFIFTRYAEEWNQLMAEEQIPDCVWELLFLAKNKQTVGSLAEDYVYNDKAAEFEYFTKSTRNASQYFSNLNERMLHILQERGLVGVYEPSIPTVARRVVRAARRTVPTVMTLESLNAAVTAGLESGHMDAPARYLHIVNLIRAGRGQYVMIREMQRFVSYAEFEVQTAMRLFGRDNERKTAYIESLRISESLRQKLIQLFVELQIDRVQTAPVAQTNELQVVRLSRLNSTQLQTLATAILNMDVTRLTELPQRIYVAVQGGEIKGVVSAHVRCECEAGRVTVHLSPNSEVTTAMLRKVEEDMTAAGREMVI